jgi:hypothetical protein
MLELPNAVNCTTESYGTFKIKNLTLNAIIKDNICSVENYLEAGSLMNKSHKGHNIIVSAARLPASRQWEPRLTVIWSQDGKGQLSKLVVNRAFRQREEAETEGLLFAKKWIDDGKPDPQ